MWLVALRLDILARVQESNGFLKCGGLLSTIDLVVSVVLLSTGCSHAIRSKPKSQGSCLFSCMILRAVVLFVIRWFVECPGNAYLLCAVYAGIIMIFAFVRVTVRLLHSRSRLFDNLLLQVAGRAMHVP